MYTPLSLAALATSAINGLNIVATCQPQFKNQNFQTTGLLDDRGRTYAITCPLNSAAGAQLEKEAQFTAQLVPLMARHALDLQVIVPRGWANLRNGGKALVHDVVEGYPLELENLTENTQLAVSLAKALGSWHNLPRWTVEEIGLPYYTDADERNRLLAKLDQGAQTGHVPSVLLERWEKQLENVAWFNFVPTVLHGDLDAESFRIVDNQVVGLTGLGSVHAGDPAKDIAWIMSSFPYPLIEPALSAYELVRPEYHDSFLRQRANLHAELAILDWLLYGINSQNQEIITDALSLLQTLANDCDESAREEALLANEVAQTHVTEVLADAEINAVLQQSVSSTNQHYDDASYANYEQPFDSSKTEN